ncbi:hypothetical protein FZC66_01670 [Priestia megaterium]|nr:hypothetical protein FZC66_01670 [Priestia megaterium]
MKSTTSKSKKIQREIEDYRRFIYVLLAVSTFLYIGVLIGNGEKANAQLLVMSGTSILFIAMAFYFAYQTKKLKQQIQEEER